MSSDMPGMRSFDSRPSPRLTLSLAALVLVSGLSLAALGTLFQMPLHPGWLGAALACTSVAGLGWLKRDGADPDEGEAVGMTVAGILLALFGLVTGEAHAPWAVAMGFAAAALLALILTCGKSRRRSPGSRWSSGAGIC